MSEEYDKKPIYHISYHYSRTAPDRPLRMHIWSNMMWYGDLSWSEADHNADKTHNKCKRGYRHESKHHKISKTASDQLPTPQTSSHELLHPKIIKSSITYKSPSSLRTISTIIPTLTTPPLLPFHPSPTFFADKANNPQQVPTLPFKLNEPGCGDAPYETAGGSIRGVGIGDVMTIAGISICCAIPATPTPHLTMHAQFPEPWRWFPRARARARALDGAPSDLTDSAKSAEHSPSDRAPTNGPECIRCV